jgi:hypothetical protein
MTKAELVTRVTAQTRLTKQQSAVIVESVFQCIMDALQEGDKGVGRTPGSVASPATGARARPKARNRWAEASGEGRSVYRPQLDGARR